MWVRVVLTAMAAAACSGEITGGPAAPDGGAGGGPDGPTSSASLRITTPAPGSVHQRSVLESGALVAEVVLTASADPAIERVEWRGPGGALLGEGVPPDFATMHRFGSDGPIDVDAFGFTADD